MQAPRGLVSVSAKKWRMRRSGSAGSWICTLEIHEILTRGSLPECSSPSCKLILTTALHLWFLLTLEGKTLSYLCSLFIPKLQQKVGRAGVTMPRQRWQPPRRSSFRTAYGAPCCEGASTTIIHRNPATTLGGKRVTIALLQLSQARKREVTTCSRS